METSVEGVHRRRALHKNMETVHILLHYLADTADFLFDPVQPVDETFVLLWHALLGVVGAAVFFLFHWAIPFHRGSVFVYSSGAPSSYTPA